MSAFQLQKTFVVLKPDLRADAVPVSDTLYQDLDRDYDQFADHTLVAWHRFENDWPSWEIHPQGDELVCLVSGAATMVLRQNGVDREVDLDSAGASVIVPANTWHTARVSEPTTMIFVTPGEGTDNRESPGGSGFDQGQTER